MAGLRPTRLAAPAQALRRRVRKSREPRARSPRSPSRSPEQQAQIGLRSRSDVVAAGLRMCCSSAVGRTTIMPVMQKPHWDGRPASRNACAPPTGCRRQQALDGLVITRSAGAGRETQAQRMTSVYPARLQPPHSPALRPSCTGQAELVAQRIEQGAPGRHRHGPGFRRSPAATPPTAPALMVRPLWSLPSCPPLVTSPVGADRQARRTARSSSRDHMRR